MKNVNLSIFMGFVAYLNFSYISNAKVVNEVSTYEKTEILNDQKFIYKQKVSDSMIEEQWYIDEQSVNFDEFQKNLLEQKQKEFHDEQKKEELKRIQEQQFKISSKIGILKKLLIIKLKEVQKGLKKINDLEKRNLTTFFVFGQNSFLSKFELDNLDKSLISSINDYLNNSQENLNLDELQEYLNKIEFYPEKLTRFFQDSINNAIKLCDDTKILKDLLELID